MEEECGLLKVGAAAKMLGVKESTIRSWILKRRIPFVRLGRLVFLRRSDIAQLIEASIVPTAGRKPGTAIKQ